jgi:hypothetical protein
MSTLLNMLRNPSITNEPPTVQEQRRSDWAVIIVILFAIVLGWGIRNNTLNAMQEFSFQGGIPSISVPASWVKAQGEGLLLRAYDPATLSTFNSSLELSTRPLRQGEDLTLINATWPLKRSQEMDRFRTLTSQAVTGPGGEPALLITYAYIADPTRESGMTGLPVVVKGQDLLFKVGEGTTQQLVVLTTVADATLWNSEAALFRAIHQRMGVRE